MGKRKAAKCHRKLEGSVHKVRVFGDLGRGKRIGTGKHQIKWGEVYAKKD